MKFFRRPAEVEFFRYHKKITQLSQFHEFIIADPLIIATQKILDAEVCRMANGRGPSPWARDHVQNTGRGRRIHKQKVFQ